MTNGERLARIEQKLDDLAGSFEAHKEEQKQEHKEVASRVSEIEKKLNYAAGAVAAISIFFGVMINYIKERLFS